METEVLVRCILQLMSAPCALCVMLVGVPSVSVAADWPQWLGPERETVWRETGILEPCPEGGPPLRWSQPLGGGYSGPAVADGRVFVMDRQAKKIDLARAKVLHDGDPPQNANFLRKLLPGSERIVCLDEKTGKKLSLIHI